MEIHGQEISGFGAWGICQRDRPHPHSSPAIHHLNQQREALMALLGDINPLNAKKRAAEIEVLLDKYIPGVEKMRTRLKKYNRAYQELKAEVASLEKEVDANKESILKRLETGQKLRELEELQKVVDNIPKEILDTYTNHQNLRKEQEIAYE